MPRKPRTSSALDASIRADHVALIDPSAPWTRERIQADLMLSPPFLDCPKGHIWTGSTFKERQAVYCRRPSVLIHASTDVLLDYFTKLTTIRRYAHDMAQHTEAILEGLDERAAMFFDLRAQRRLSPSAQRYVHERTLRTHLEQIRRWLHSLTDADYLAHYRPLERAVDYPRLCYELSAAFRDNGPAYHWRTFSLEVRYGVCAAIVIHFQLEHGCLSTVADTFGRYVRSVRPRPQ